MEEPEIRQISPNPVIRAAWWRYPVSRRKRMLKRGIDVLVAALGLAISSPLLLVIAAGIGWTSGRPVLFRQQRLGYMGRSFSIRKFRTMIEARDDEGRPLPDEGRLTLLGRFLRRTSLDELPELFNVLVGDMSMVGPRPLLPEYDELYSPAQRRRHEMPPGIAGPVQAYGRNALDWEQKFALDVWYVDNWSLWVDSKLLVLSMRTALTGRGVSAAGHATMPPFEGAPEREGDT
jgi:sugar transferase EpsL